MGSPHRLRPRSDPTHYPIEDDLGEGSLQRFIAELLRPLVERWLATRGEACFVGADQFIYYQQFNPKKCVCPDVYVIPGEPPGLDVGCWKLWEMKRPPSFAFECVSTDRDKDYLRSPPRYADLGLDELVIFDPKAGVGRARFQVHRRLARRGFIRTSETDGDRVHSRVLGCWLRAVGTGESTRIRLATGPGGADLFPTEAESQQVRAEAEERRAELERERAESEKRRAESAVAENTRLRAELAQLKRR
jgi:Uma2 family endonuclease